MGSFGLLVLDQNLEAYVLRVLIFFISKLFRKGYTEMKKLSETTDARIRVDGQ